MCHNIMSDDAGNTRRYHILYIQQEYSLTVDPAFEGLELYVPYRTYECQRPGVAASAVCSSLVSSLAYRVCVAKTELL